MLLIRWFIAASALLATAYLIPDIHVSGIYIALIVALILGLINATIRPILILLTLPINILTLGLFSLVINAILFWFVASFVDGFAIATFTAAFLGALLLAVISSLANWLVKKL